VLARSYAGHSRRGKPHEQNATISTGSPNGPDSTSSVDGHASLYASTAFSCQRLMGVLRNGISAAGAPVQPVAIVTALAAIAELPGRLGSNTGADAVTREPVRAGAASTPPGNLRQAVMAAGGRQLLMHVADVMLPQGAMPVSAIIALLHACARLKLGGRLPVSPCIELCCMLCGQNV
jgi:hypothetical protein